MFPDDYEVEGQMSFGDLENQNENTEEKILIEVADVEMEEYRQKKRLARQLMIAKQNEPYEVKVRRSRASLWPRSP